MGTLVWKEPFVLLTPWTSLPRIDTSSTDPDSICEINSEKVISTVKFHGNTSAASIPLALDYGFLSNKIKDGELVGFQAIGGGLSWGASVIRFGKPKNI